VQKPPFPDNEQARLSALRQLQVLDTAPEDRFDRITDLARRFFGTPIALVSLVDADRQWFKSRIGLDACETPREVSFCGHAILTEETFVVRDAASDGRFSDNPLVTGEPFVRFYAGHPLVAPGGERIGTLCVIDHVPRPFTEADAAALADFAALVEAQLADVELLRLVRDLAESEDQFRSVFEDAPIGMAVVDLDGPLPGRYLDVNPALCQMVGRTREEMLTLSFLDVDHPDERETSRTALAALRNGARVVRGREKRYVRADGSELWVSVNASLIGECLPGDCRAVVHVEDITIRRHAEAELARMALHDPLTGLPNRILFTDHLEMALADLDRSGGLVAVMFVDLDGFKEVNDSHGHNVGDRVLVEAADRLRRAMRHSDTLARYGGDEFAAVCRALNESGEAAEIGRRLAGAMDPPVFIDDIEIRLGASVGVAVTDRTDHDVAALLSEADAAMYRAKSAVGRAAVGA